MTPSRRITGLAALSATLLTVACASAPVTRADPFAGTDEADVVTVTLHNHDTRNAVVYAHWDGLRERVGTVIAMQSETFRTRWRNDRMQLGIEFFGSLDGYRTEYIDVTRGDHLDYVILARH